MHELAKKHLILGAGKNAPKNKPIDVENIKPIIKEKKTRYRSPSDRFLDWVTKGVAVLGISLALFMGMNFMNVGKVDLPEPTEVYQNVETLNIGTEILTKMDSGHITRFITQKGEPIKIGVSDNFTAEEKQVIEECIEKYNKVFEVINPEYKFVIDDETSKLEQMDPNYIQIKTIGELEGNTVAYESSGGFPTINGFDTTYNQVYMGEASRQNINMFRNTFLHEFMHALGVADAYLVPGFYEGTIMNCTASYTKTNDIYKYDVALLAALYGDLSDPENLARIQKFIENYGANSTYTDTSSCKYIEESNVQNIKTPKVNENEEGMTF